MTRVLPPLLLALTAGDLTPGAMLLGGTSRLRAAVARAVAAGLRGVLLREPGLPDGAYLTLAVQLRQVLAPHGGWLGLHDRPHLVTAAGAQGVHLGFRSLPPGEARAAAGPDACLGLSTHLGDEPEAWAGCDYRFFGPVRATPSKEGILEPTGFQELARATTSAPPVWALGGLRPEDVAQARAAGAAGVAALGGVLGAADPAAATAAYLEALA